MRDLRLVEMSDDHSHLVLCSELDEQFRVPADERLRAALRGDRARLGQLEITMDNVLRPRDIQARIRSGETPEAVAASAQAPLERIMGYAVPVLAERAHFCERARRATIRRKHTSGPSRLLGDTVDDALRDRGSDPEAAQWDSWRRDDGRWAVTVRPARDAATAMYVFDVPGRYVLAGDDEARSLIADLPPADDPTEMAIASAVAEAELSQPTEAAPSDAEPAVTSIRRARSLRTGVEEVLPREERPVDQPLEQVRAVGDNGIDAIARATSDPATAEANGRAMRRRERRRMSVPSWDEIMFGGKPGSD